MFQLLQLLQLIVEMLRLIKDSDKDGRPDIFDSSPIDPKVK